MTDHPKRASKGKLLVLPGSSALVRPALSRPFGLFLDVDGTIAPVAASPELATVPDQTQRVIARLVVQLDLVAVVSGRPALDADRVVGVPGVITFGNHGLERLERGEFRADDRALALSDRNWAAAVAVAQAVDDPALWLERKPPAVSIHYRQSEHPERTRKRLLRLLRPGVNKGDYQLLEGRRVVEVRPSPDRTKGDAVASLCREKALAGAIYVGDDQTDVFGFNAIKQFRANGGVGLAVAVANPEAAPEVRASADFALKGVEGVYAFLTWLSLETEHWNGRSLANQRKLDLRIGGQATR